MPSCTTTRTSASSRTETPTKSTTAAPASPYGRRLVNCASSAGRPLHAVEGTTEDVAQLGAGDAPEHRDQPGGHQRDEHPARDVPALAVTARLQARLERDEQ